MTEQIEPEHVAALAGAAGLPLPAERVRELAGAAQALLADCRKLGAIDVSDVEAPVVFPHA